MEKNSTMLPGLRDCESEELSDKTQSTELSWGGQGPLGTPHTPENQECPCSHRGNGTTGEVVARHL